MKLGLSILLIFLVSVGLGHASPNQQAPLTKDQVLALVNAGLDDGQITTIVKERGIDFEPTTDYIRALREAGAQAGLIAWLRGLKPAPLTRQQVLQLLGGGVPSQRVATIVAERGISFRIDDKYLDTLQAAGADDAVIQAVRAAHAAREADLQQHVAGAREFEKKNLWPQAGEEYQRAMQISPDEAGLHLGLGNVFAQQSKWTEAVAEYREALRLQPDFLEAQLKLADAMKNLKNKEEAINEYRKAVHLHPDSEEAHYRLSAALHDKKDLDGEIGELREAIRIKSDFVDAHFSLGLALSDKNMRDAAIAEWREVLHLQPRHEGAHLRLGEALFWWKENPNGAISELQDAISLKPDDPEAHFTMGRALEKKDRKRALDEYLVACQLAPTNAAYRDHYEKLRRKLK